MIYIEYYKHIKFRLPQYLCGVITGFMMHKATSSRRSNPSTYGIAVGWILSIGFMLTHVFYRLYPQYSAVGRTIYDSVFRELWAASICWIIYACHQLQSGGLLRRFLNQSSWQPLSKICLSVYLTHYLYIFLTCMNLKELQWVETWWQIHIHIGDIFISFFIATIFYLVVEAPTVRLVQLFVIG